MIDLEKPTTFITISVTLEKKEFVDKSAKDIKPKGPVKRLGSYRNFFWA